MKTVLVTIKTPGDGDEVFVEAASAGGGISGAKHRVKGPRLRPKLDADGFATEVENVPAETANQIAAALANQINNGGDLPAWNAECAKASAKDDMLIIHCTPLFMDTTFTTHVDGEGGTILSLTEL